MLLLMVSLCVFLSGCGVHQKAAKKSSTAINQTENVITQADADGLDLEAEFESAEAKPVSDPLGGYNRLMTKFNDRFYYWLLKPTAQGYRTVTPEIARLAVGRFFNNLLMPVRLTNNLLQLKMQRAGTELARFVVNSTVGVLGFGDPAGNSFNLQPYPEDFGQTLGHYGIGSGFHLVLPLLGPSNLRDALGLVPDYYLTPVNYIDPQELRLAASAIERINFTSLHIGEYESLQKDAVDFYILLRDGYEQRRAQKVKE